MHQTVLAFVKLLVSMSFVCGDVICYNFSVLYFNVLCVNMDDCVVVIKFIFRLKSLFNAMKCIKYCILKRDWQWSTAC